MKAKGVASLVTVSVLIAILIVGYQSVAAAPPTGEVKTVTPVLGNEIPIPFFESTSADDWMQLLYDHLVGTTPEGKFSPANGLAHKVEMSRDALTWTFYLRKEVKFHDGVEVTAKDVKFSIDRLMAPDATAFNGIELRQKVKTVEIKDPYTVVVRLKIPDIFLPDFLNNTGGPGGMVVPKDYFERIGKDEFQRHPIGSGPYKFHSQQVGSFIKLEATDRHWRDGVPKYKYMTYFIIPEESTRMAMLKTGEADIARISRESLKEAVSSGMNVISKEAYAVLIYVPNMQWTSPAFSDIRFRKALNLAVDKEAIIKHLLGGMAKPVATWPGSNISAIGGDAKLKPYPYDPQEARRLIKEGGWEGYEFNFVSYARGGLPEIIRINEAMAGYWEKVGLKPKIRMTDYAAWRKAWRSRSRECENTMSGVDSFTDVPTLIRGFMQRYYFRYLESAVNIPELNERFERIEKTLDLAEALKITTEIYRYAYDHYLVVPICELSELIATSKKIPKWDLGRRRNDRNYYELIRQR